MPTGTSRRLSLSTQNPPRARCRWRCAYGREALAWGYPDHCYDAHGNSGKEGGQGGRLDGAGHRRTSGRGVRSAGAIAAFGISIQTSAPQLPNCLLIENASDRVLLPGHGLCPRHFRSRLATIRKLARSFCRRAALFKRGVSEISLALITISAPRPK